MATDDELETYESTTGLSVEAGLYPAAVKSVEAVSGAFGDQWKFAFTLDDHPTEEAWAWATAKLGTKTKLYRWAGILLGRPLAVGERLSRYTLVGMRCRVLIVEKTDGDGEARRVVEDILKVETAKAAPAPAPTAQAPRSESDVCFCGGPVFSYSPTGEPLCETHADPAIATDPVIEVVEMKSQYDFQREAHKHFGIQTLAAGLKKAGFANVMDVSDWPMAWKLLCEKMAEPK